VSVRKPRIGYDSPMRTRHLALIAVAAILVIALVDSLANRNFPSREDAPLAHLAAAPADGRSAAQLSVVSGATTLSVRSADIGGDLFRVSTPPTSGQVPAVVVNGDIVQVQLRDVATPDGSAPGPSALQVLLSDDVTWALRLDGGATETQVSLASGRLSSLDFGAGSARIEATLPRPHGAVPVRMSGGASAYNLHLPDGVPARVRMGGGAGSVTVDGVQHSGIAGGTTWAGPGFAAAGDKYDIDNTAGVSTLTLDRA
jgi:hypothetical protein